MALAAVLALFAAACGGDDGESAEGGDAGDSGGSTAPCTFGEIFTTDGRIPELGLTIVEDDGVFILYNASINLRDEVYEQNPEAFDEIADLLLDPLDNDTAAELNNRVGSQGEDQSAVAAEFLEEQGLTGEDGTLSEYDLSGIDITVGSKDFTEQLVLGEMIAQAYEAAGANVTNQVNLGGTEVNRAALLSGDIDAYAEYNGTGWTVHLGQEDPATDPETLTEDVREMDLEENGIRWLGRSPFNNTYGFAVNQDYVDAEGVPTLQDMADYLEANPDATVCMESEFPDRPDGLVLFEEATGFEIPDDQIEILDTNLIYTETAGS
jgi:glycine betaine/choline ABC-type transport system substrate-binding protein